MQPPPTKYATAAGDIHLAYQVIGDGPRDLVFVPPAWSHLDLQWEQPACSRFFARLGSFSRTIIFDKRGTGLSDRVPNPPTLEERMDDVRAVMDAARSQRAVLFGNSEGGPMSILFSATYPEKVAAMVLCGSMAKYSTGPDYPWGTDSETYRLFIDFVEQRWGQGDMISLWAPSRANDESFKRWWSLYERAGATPSAMRALVQSWMDIDVRHLLPAVRVPTLILHVVGDRACSLGGARFLAERIPGAKLVEAPGDDHLYFGDAGDRILDEVEEFLTGVRRQAEIDRALATIMFTDIVGSTERAAQLGDRQWRDLLDSYYAVIRRQLGSFRGREVKTIGDGFLATFDGPARAIRCACAIREDVRRLGIDVRAGLHTGECELMGEDVGGIAVHIADRVAKSAGAGEVIVSSTVKDLVAGSGIPFGDRGPHALKGVPGEWRLFTVQTAA